MMRPAMSDVLSYDVHAAAEPGGPIIILLHGRGAGRGDLAGLRPYLPPDATLVLPDAPFPGAPWGYGPGRAWYRYLGGTTPEPESFEAAQQALAAFVDAVPLRIGRPEARIVLGGFSQGGTMSLGHGARQPGRVAALLVFSGFLPEHPSVAASALAGTPIFWGHGTADPAIFFEYAVQGRAALAAAGARLEARDYPVGHAILPEELADATRWLGDVLDG
jgi:phospholipase/carboxylesterase